MGKFAGEKYVMIPLALNTSTTTEVRSKGVSLRGVDKVTVLCGYELGLNVLDSAAQADSSLAHAGTFAVYVGDATQGAASFAALASATCVLGMSTRGQVRNAESIQIQVVGSWATGRELTISYGPTTVTFTLQTNASLADNQLSASDATAFGGALTAGIAARFPNLEVVEGTTVGSGDTVAWTGILKEKIVGQATLSAAVTVQDVSTSAIGNVNVHRSVGVIEFTPAQVLATNTSYTQFCVGIDASVTVTKQYAVAILEMSDEPVKSHVRETI
jgi:hypothetical protein